MNPNAVERLNAALSGRYQVERQLGEGGMAKVYLARDLRHNRNVALKVLRPELAAVLGAERFVVEIKTTASLQHPHILPLFDSGTADGFLYYVMPFVEGETLRDKLNRETQLAVDEAVRITADVADALDYAHRHGVIHRDIKPENILLHDGRPVVADFGIALAVSAAAGGRMTETGLSLGTPYYMSPEQATADKDLTGRSDIYSLASVLYEMLTGEPPHMGSSAQQIIMKIIADVPRPVTELRKSVPPNVASAVARALEKLPADRFASPRSFVEALNNPGFRHGAMLTGSGASLTQRSRTRDPVFLAVVGVAVVAVVVAGAALLSRGSAGAPASATRVVLDMPAGQRFGKANVNPSAPAHAVSPDGSEIVYRSGGGLGSRSGQLWRRRLDALEASPIAGTEGATSPAFSRDGAFLAFSTGGERLGVIPAPGGAPVWLPLRTEFFAWGDDGALYFWWEGVLQRWVPGTPAAEEIELQSDTTERPGLIVSDVLPGSRALLTAGESMHVVDLTTGRTRALGPGFGPRYLATGHIVFARDDGTLMIQPFDARSLTTTGPAVATPDRVQVTALIRDFSIGSDGSLVYEAFSIGRGKRLAWMDRQGRSSLIDWIEEARFDGISLSPGGDRVAASFSDSTRLTRNDLWIFDLASRTRLRLTRDGASSRPEWHPVEQRLLYVHSDSAGETLRTIPVDGSAPGELLVPLTNAPADAFWTGDGKEILIRMPGKSTRSIFRFTPGSGEPPVPFLDRPFLDRNPAPSPDGRWLVYTSDQSGRDEVYAQPYPSGGAVVPVSIDGGLSAVWSRDGREVFYVGADRGMWAARVTYDARTFRVDERVRLFSTEEIETDSHRPSVDVAPDGRFLVQLQTPGEPTDELVLVRNWVQMVTGRD